MGDLDPNKMREAIVQGLTPLDRRIASYKNSAMSQAWVQFAQGPTKKLLAGDITVDEWKHALGGFCTKLAQGIPPAEAEAVLRDASGAALAVEEVFDPPSPMRWLVIGGVAATALAYWWLKREEGEKEKLVAATPALVAGTPRKRRPATLDLEEVEAEFEEV